VLGDYVAGPAHPATGGRHILRRPHRDQFQRRTSVVEYTKPALKKALTAVKKFAELEGLSAHETAPQSDFEPPLMKNANIFVDVDLTLVDAMGVCWREPKKLWKN